MSGMLKQQCCNAESEPVSPGGWASAGIRAGAGTVLTEDDVVFFVITILQLPAFLGILAGVLVQVGVYSIQFHLPKSFTSLLSKSF